MRMISALHLKFGEIFASTCINELLIVISIFEFKLRLEVEPSVFIEIYLKPYLINNNENDLRITSKIWRIFFKYKFK
jgi:hypothetical protein